jgi:hypothetical protein
MQLNKFDFFDRRWLGIIFINASAAINDYPSSSAFAAASQGRAGLMKMWPGIRISIIAQLMDIEHIDSLTDSIEKACHNVQSS